MIYHIFWLTLGISCTVLKWYIKENYLRSFFFFILQYVFLNSLCPDIFELADLLAKCQSTDVHLAVFLVLFLYTQLTINY